MATLPEADLETLALFETCRLLENWDRKVELDSRLSEAGVPLDSPWAEVQLLERNDERVPIRGGAGTMRVVGAISASLQEGGYKNSGRGYSYIQTVSWDESDCPIIDTILTHSPWKSEVIRAGCEAAMVVAPPQWHRGYP